MRYILILFLCLFFAYALGLVILNNTETAVNLPFMQAPAMNLGLLLIICLLLGLMIGMLLSVLVFRVLQNKWELSRLRKENGELKGKLETATAHLEKAQAKSMIATPIATNSNDSKKNQNTETKADQ